MEGQRFIIKTQNPQVKLALTTVSRHISQATSRRDFHLLPSVSFTCFGFEKQNNKGIIHHPNDERILHHDTCRDLSRL